jgi:hypothetical protein
LTIFVRAKGSRSSEPVVTPLPLVFRTTERSSNIRGSGGAAAGAPGAGADAGAADAAGAGAAEGSERASSSLSRLAAAAAGAEADVVFAEAALGLELRQRPGQPVVVHATHGASARAVPVGSTVVAIAGESISGLSLAAVQSRIGAAELSLLYRYILRESCSQFDSLPLTSLTIPQVRRSAR